MDEILHVEKLRSGTFLYVLPADKMLYRVALTFESIKHAKHPLAIPPLLFHFPFANWQYKKNLTKV